MVDVLAFAAECQIPGSQKEILDACWAPLEAENGQDPSIRAIHDHPHCLQEDPDRAYAGHVPGSYLDQQTAPVLEAITPSQGTAGEAGLDATNAGRLQETPAQSGSPAENRGTEGRPGCGDFADEEAVGSDMIPSLSLSEPSPTRIGIRQDTCVNLQLEGLPNGSSVSLIGSFQPQTQSPGFMAHRDASLLGQLSASLRESGMEASARQAAEAELAARAAWAESLIGDPPPEEDEAVLEEQNEADVLTPGPDTQPLAHELQESQATGLAPEAPKPWEVTTGMFGEDRDDAQTDSCEPREHPQQQAADASARQAGSPQLADTASKMHPNLRPQGEVVGEPTEAQGDAGAEELDCQAASFAQTMGRPEQERSVMKPAGKMVADSLTDSDLVQDLGKSSASDLDEPSSVPETQAVSEQQVEVLPVQRQQPRVGADKGLQSVDRAPGEFQVLAGEKDMEMAEGGAGEAANEALPESSGEEIVEIVLTEFDSSTDEEDSGEVTSQPPAVLPCTQTVGTEYPQHQEMNRDGGDSTSSGDFEIIPASPIEVSSSSEPTEAAAPLPTVEVLPKGEEMSDDGQPEAAASQGKEDAADASRVLRTRRRVRGPSKRNVGKKAPRQEDCHNSERSTRCSNRGRGQRRPQLDDDCPPEGKRNRVNSARLGPTLAAVRQVVGWGRWLEDRS